MKRNMIVGVMILLFSSTYGEMTSVTLSNAMELALKNNLQLQQTEKDFKIAEAQYNGTIADFCMPSISLSGNFTYIDPTTVSNSIVELPPVAMYTNPKVPTTFYPVSISAQMAYADNYSTELSITKPLFTGFRLWNSMEIKKRNFELAKAKLDDMKSQITSSTAISFYNLFLLKESISLALELDSNLKDRADYTRANYKAGMTAQYDSIRAEVAYENHHPELLKISNAYRSSKMDFCNSIGVKDYNHTEFVGNLADSTNIELLISEDEAIPLALSNDINLKTVHNTIDTLKLSKEIAQSVRYPALSAFFNDDYSYGMGGLLATSRTWGNSWNAGLQLSIPIDSLLPVSKTAFNIDETEQNIQKAELILLQTIEGVTLKVRNLVMQIDQAKQAMDSQSGTLKQAKLGLDIVSSHYKAGDASLLDVNDAEVNYTQSRLAYLQAMHDYYSSTVQLKRITGK